MNNYTRLAACLLAVLCLTGCGKKAPEPPEFYAMGEDSTLTIDSILEEGEGTLGSVHEPKEEEDASTPPYYTYAYDDVASPSPVVDRYLDRMLEEEGFVLVDQENQVLTERPVLEDLVGEVILERPSVEEGKVFQVAVGWSEKGRLTARVSSFEGAIIQPEPPQEEEPEPASVGEQIQHLLGMSPQELGLEGTTMDGYEIYPVEGFVKVDDTVTCRRFQVYELRQPEGVPVIVGSYLVSTDKQSVYSLDPETNQLTQLR